MLLLLETLRNVLWISCVLLRCYWQRVYISQPSPEPTPVATEREKPTVTHGPPADLIPEVAAKAKPKPIVQRPKRIQKLVSTHPTPPPPEEKRAPTSVPPRRRSSPPPKSPSPPPRQATPLPDFITQFKGTEWFEKYFPSCNENVSIVLCRWLSYDYLCCDFNIIKYHNV